MSSTAKGPAVRGADERAFPQTPTRESQRFLLGLMNALISEFAEREGLDPASAAAFLGDIGIRDSVPEFVLESNEVPEKYAPTQRNR